MIMIRFFLLFPSFVVHSDFWRVCVCVCLCKLSWFVKRKQSSVDCIRLFLLVSCASVRGKNDFYRNKLPQWLPTIVAIYISIADGSVGFYRRTERRQDWCWWWSIELDDLENWWTSGEFVWTNDCNRSGDLGVSLGRHREQSEIIARLCQMPTRTDVCLSTLLSIARPSIRSSTLSVRLSKSFVLERIAKVWSSFFVAQLV